MSALPRKRHHADPVHRQRRAGARAEQPLLPVLRQSPRPSGMLFLEELEELKDRFMQRLSLFHVISGEEQDIPILHGRLDGEKVQGIVALAGAGPRASTTCSSAGPAGMSEDIEATCRDIGIADERIHVERFVSEFGGKPRPEEGHRSVGAAQGDGVADHRRQAPRGAGRRGGIHPRCGAARRHGSAVRLQGRHVLDLPRQLVEGEAQMEGTYSLEPWELKAGFILTCQARPCSDKVVVDYDHV